jgi:hypothetical protein
MDFDEPNAQAQDLLHVGQNIAGVPRMYAPTR